MNVLNYFLSEPFKKCSMCGKIWKTRDEFISDPEVIYLGYSADFESIENGIFLFNHDAEICKTTLATKVDSFFDLYSGERWVTRMYGTSECAGYCLDKKSTAACHVKCECAFIRDVINKINKSREIGH